MWTFHEQSNTTGYVSDVKQALLTITKEEAEIAMQGVKCHSATDANCLNGPSITTPISPAS